MRVDWYLIGGGACVQVNIDSCRRQDFQSIFDGGIDADDCRDVALELRMNDGGADQDFHRVVERAGQTDSSTCDDLAFGRGSAERCSEICIRGQVEADQTFATLA